MNKRYPVRLLPMLGLLILGLMALDASAADKWTSLRSKNFNLVGSATEAQIRAVAVELEQFREAFTTIFVSTSKAATVPITVVVFKSDNALKELTGNFQRAEDVNYITLTAGAPIPRSVYHHFVHELSRDLPNTVPLWFTEGLAEFYSAIEILPKEKKYALGQSISEHVDVLKKNPFVTFDELSAFDRSSPQYNERDRKGIYYAQSWALVNYLLVGVNGTRQSQIIPFLSSITEGKPAAESFQTAFKIDPKAFLSELDYYVRVKSAWAATGSSLKEKGEIEKEFKTRSLTEAEAEFYMGDLFLHSSQLTNAEAHLLQATVLDPKLASAQASMGMLRFRQDKPEESIQFLKRAVDLDQRNYVSQYYFAYVLDKNSTSPLDELDAKRGALGKAIELMPQYAPAYELLAFINLTADIDYDGTLELLQNANKMAPGNLNLRFLMAQAFVKKEEFDKAARVLETLVKNSAADLPIREGARTLINNIERTRETENKQRDTDAENARRDEEAARAASRARASAEPAPVVEPEKETGSSLAPRPKSGELVLVTPTKARPQGTKAAGLLTLMDCRNGVTITLKTPAGTTLLLHTDNPQSIEFVSFNTSVSASISCGPAPGAGIPVVITYRPTAGGEFAGVPLEVEFVDK